MSFKFDGTRFKAWSDSGAPLSGGLLYSYVSGTTTNKATYTDATLGGANTNPIVLDARGEADVWLGSGAYTFLLKTSAGVTVDTVDGIQDPATIEQDTVVDLFDGTGSQTGFTLSQAPGSAFNLDVEVDGISLVPSVDYNVSGTALTISAAPPSGTDNVVVKHRAEAVSSVGDATTIAYTQGGVGAVERTVSARLRDYISVKDFGAVGDGVTDDTAAIDLAIAHCMTLARRRLHFPQGKYLVSASLTSITGNNWSITGDGINVTHIKCSVDAPIFRIDVSAANSYFGLISGISFEGSNSGTDTSSSCVKVIASTSSTTGLLYWDITGNSFTGTRYGVHLQDTGKTSFSGYTSITSHGYLRFTENVITPTLPVEIGFYAEGAFGLHSKFVGNQFRGSVAGMRLGTGDALDSIGDIVIVGNEFLTGQLGLDLIGPTTAGAYNQNILVACNQFDNLTVNTIKATDLKNFRFFPNNSTASVGISLTNCSEYSTEDRGAFVFNSPTDAYEIYGQIVLSDTNGVRIAQDLAFRRSVNTAMLKFAGGNATNAGALLQLYGGAHATLPDQAFLDAARFRVRSQSGAATLFDVNPASSSIGFFGATPVTKPTGVPVTAADIHAALVSLGLIAA